MVVLFGTRIGTYLETQWAKEPLKHKMTSPGAYFLKNARWVGSGLVLYPRRRSHRGPRGTVTEQEEESTEL